MNELPVMDACLKKVLSLRGEGHLFADNSKNTYRQSSRIDDNLGSVARLQHVTFNGLDYRNMGG